MIRKILTPTEPELKLRLPPEYLHQEVEVLVFPVNSVAEKDQAASSNEARLQDAFHKAVHALKGKLDVDPVAWQRELRQQWQARDEKAEQLWTETESSC